MTNPRPCLYCGIEQILPGRRLVCDKCRRGDRSLGKRYYNSKGYRVAHVNTQRKAA